MAKRLVKIAKELNVGTSTIVDHLANNGFEIENKPTAKVSDEMYDVLLKEFQNSLAIKEQADQLVIGNRINPKKEETKAPKDELFSPKAKTPTPPAKEPVSAPTPPVEEPVVEEVVPDIIEEVVETPVVEAPTEEVEKPKIGLTIKGKIDLNKKPEPKEEIKEPTVEEPVVEEEVVEDKTPTPPVVEEPVVEEEVAVPEAKAETPKAEVSKTEEPTSEGEMPEEAIEDTEETSKTDDSTQTESASNEMIRAKTPQLKGLKILGKIDTDKLKRPKKKKKKKEDKPTDASKTAGAKKTGESPDSRSKRKRKRKIVPANPNNRQTSGGGGGGRNNNNNSGGSGNNNRNNQSRGGRGGSRRPETREVSQKQIDEKIKQTMARLSGGGKKKRQKLRRDNRDRHREKQELIESQKETGKLQLTEFISVSELAGLMNISPTEVIMTCMNLGVIVSINQRLDAEIIELVAEEFDHEVEFISAEEQIEEEDEIIDDPADLKPRAPIVTVMGHVDHGKTSLLDYIRKANVAEGEAGGITQHIGAHEVRVGEEQKPITFLDTPGHEAFTAMRARGAKVTDIVVIIIAADDSIMPQTKEAISHAQAAGVPMVFAINKMDKDGANPEKIKQELASMNFLVESWGGKYQSQDISAKTGMNIDLLLEKILLEAELLELSANPDLSLIHI